MLNETTQGDLALVQFPGVPYLSLHETFTIFITTTYFILGFPSNLLLIVYFIIKRMKLSSSACEWNRERRKSISIERSREIRKERSISIERGRVNFQRGSSAPRTSSKNTGIFEGKTFFNWPHNIK